jgi:hypothetical protein
VCVGRGEGSGSGWRDVLVGGDGVMERDWGPPPAKIRRRMSARVATATARVLVAACEAGRGRFFSFRR